MNLYTVDGISVARGSLKYIHLAIPLPVFVYIT